MREETGQEVFNALRKEAGSFVSIASTTGTGKTYATIHYSPKKTISIYRNYRVLEETETLLREKHGKGKVRVMYGRIAPPKNLKDLSAQQRYERAGCPNYQEMKKRSERGHSSCAGCPLAPQKGKDGGGENLCPYWKQRLETLNHPPDFLLTTPQSFACNPDLLKLLPEEGTGKLFHEYKQFVIDDCPGFISDLSRERKITQGDIEQWREHPALDHQKQEDLTLSSWLNMLLSLFEKKKEEKENFIFDFKRLQKLSQTILSFETFVCEEPIEGERLPLRAIRHLSSWLSKGHSACIKKGEKDWFFKYLQPSSELLERFKWMTVVHLDATPDESILKWFSELTEMNFTAPEMKRRFPRIIQIPDLLWDRDQVKERMPFFRALTEHIHDQEGMVLGFKNREGEEEHHLALDGHWGYSERGLNCYTGVKSVALIGHYAPPIQEIEGIAWRMRELSQFMGGSEPDKFIEKEFSKTRVYSDPWRPFTREMHTSSDQLIEHIRRHRHTAGVVQGANRPRNFDAPVYVFSGEPLDGLPWEVPVELQTQEELIETLELKWEESDIKPQKILNTALQTINEKKKLEKEERIEGWMLSVRLFVKGLGRLPGIRELRRFLSQNGKMIRQDLAYQILAKLREKEADVKRPEPIDLKEQNDGQIAIEWGVPTYCLNINKIRPQVGTPQSKENFSLEMTKNAEELPFFRDENETEFVNQEGKEPILPSVILLAQKMGKNIVPLQEQKRGREPDILPFIPLTQKELEKIVPLARVKLGHCNFGRHDGWNDDVIRQVSKVYHIAIDLLYRFIGVMPKKFVLT
jgi:hypothetical protein